jgi:hypothetical protein
MNITVRIAGGRYYGQVRDGKRLMFHTPGYLTEAMALADAKCWTAFNDKGETVEDIVKDTQTFQTRSGYDGSLQIVGPDRMRATIANAEQYKVSVSVMTNDRGRKYINIHNGGSSYGRYFYMS